jgi:hypothetical protein
MMARHGGLRSVEQQRALGWPNLKRATGMYQLRCRFRRHATGAGLSVAACQSAWDELMHMGLQTALEIDMAVWMEKRQQTAARDAALISWGSKGDAHWRRLMRARVSARLREVLGGEGAH